MCGRMAGSSHGSHSAQVLAIIKFRIFCAEQPEGEKPAKRDEVNIVDPDGLHMVNGLRKLGHVMPEILAVDVRRERRAKGATPKPIPPGIMHQQTHA